MGMEKGERREGKAKKITEYSSTETEKERKGGETKESSCPMRYTKEGRVEVGNLTGYGNERTSPGWQKI